MANLTFTCPTAAWRRLPLATHPTNLTNFSTATLVDWARSTAAHASGESGALAALLLAALLLLLFTGWRLALCCASCCCPSRRPRLLRRRSRSKDSATDRTAEATAARRILRGRVTRGLKAALLLCALGTLGSCIYGLSQAHTTFVSGEPGVRVLKQAEGLAAGALDAGDRLLLSLVDLGNATHALAQQLEAAGPAYAPVTQQPRQQLGSSQAQLGAATSALRGELARLRPATLGALQQAETTYLPLAQSGVTMLQGVLYATFSLLATTALLTAAGAAVDWPAAAKPALALLLLGSLLGWALGAAATLLLRGGNDVCVSLEPLLLSLSGDAPLAQYLLLGQGGSLLGVLYASGSTGVDVYAAPAAATQTLDALRAATQGWPPELAAAVLPAVEEAAGALTAVLGRLGELEAATAFDAVRPVYLAAKSLACCSALDAAGRLFAALLASGSCALAAALLACVWLRRIDRLGDNGCCHLHSVRDWSLEAQHWKGGEGGSSQGEETPAAGGPAGKQAVEGTKSPPLNLTKAKTADPCLGASAPPSPAILAGRANSWAFAAAGNGMWNGLLAQPSSPAAPAQALVQRCHSLPPVRGPAASGWRPQAAEDFPPPAVALPCPAAGQLPPVLEVADRPSDGGCEPECSAPPLPAMESEASLAALEETARAAAQLAGHAFSAASRAAGMLNDAARLARASLSGQGMAAGQQGAGAASQLEPVPQQARPLERQPSRIPRPYLNY